ncbi:MAG TPA: hypothetical protein VNA12_10305 [Mycobacteriales bacterium]|nr:hypothetical protein [Mycobacteriales bacterium]
MRSRLLLALCLLASLVVSGSARAEPKPEPGPGFVKTSNVEYLGTVPLDGDTAGARLLGKTFYVLTAKGLTIYDVTNPLIPVPLGATVLPHTPNQEREDVDTNGKILIAGQSYLGILYVVDVSNPRLPVLLSRLSGAADHTNSCILDCTYVYGSEGTITDLRDPKNPKVVGDTGINGHDVTEIQPGLVMTASNPIFYLDARRNPARPTRIGGGSLGDDGNYYNHGVEWPRGGADRFVLAGTENSFCSNEKLGSFQVLDASSFAKTRRLKHVSTFYLEQGLQTEGKSPINEYCGHWFKPRPDFRNGGIVAMAWYGFGVRFLEVTPKGDIVEKGYFVPLPGHSSSAYWMNDEIVYALDYTARGFDILRFDGNAPAERDPVNPGRSVRVDRDLVPSTVVPVRRGNQYVCPVPTSV